MKISLELIACLEASGWVKSDSWHVGAEAPYYRRQSEFGIETIYQNIKGQVVYADSAGIEIIAITPEFDSYRQVTLFMIAGAVDGSKCRREAAAA